MADLRDEDQQRPWGGKFHDAISGEESLACEERRVMLKSRGVCEKRQLRQLKECWEKTGKRPVGVKWVGVKEMQQKWSADVG